LVKNSFPKFFPLEQAQQFEGKWLEWLES